MVINKLVLALGLVGTAFAVATIVLAVFLANDEVLLKECEAKLVPIPDTTTTTTTTTTSPPTEQPEEAISYRLPTDVIPSLYTLHINPNLNTRLFNGTNDITVDVVRRTNVIFVHSNGLTIDSVGFSTGARTVQTSFELITRQEFLRIQLAEYVEPGQNYLLSIGFSGDMRNRIVGLYSSSYVNPAGQTRLMATSKFEPTYARQAFPCFDEPAMKARFKISLVRPLGDNYIALSNMNEERVEEDTAAQTAVVHFAESVPMSTYLSCFIVSDFAFKQLPVDARGVGDNFTLRAFATPAQLEKVTFALDTAKDITEFYIDYFQEEYPLPKLDMAAIPDFVSGAMEHWGLVTFRETALLYDPTISSTANKLRVANVVAHEIAHMWFGNLVTMAWWDELWLNEGFASYIQYKGVNAALPDWKILNEFTISDLQSVMTLDGTLASHPIVQTAENPDQITELFDSITYSKGSSIIRMLEDFVGPQVFRRAVSNYLKAHKYKNAVTEDLLLEVEKLLPDLDVKYIMSTWTKQMGYPVVSVELVEGNRYRLTQTRFLSNPENVTARASDSEFNYRWYIPITWKTDADQEPKRIWFNNADNEIPIDVGAHKWLKLNYDQVGYYRINYSPAMWQSLTDALLADVTSFSVMDRGHLLNDVFSLAEATQVKYATALQLTSYLKNEPNYVPWTVAASKLNGLRTSLYYTELFAKFNQFGKSIIQAPYERTTWTVGNDYVENQQRNTILSLACSMGVQGCLDRAGDEFAKWLANPSVRPHPDLRSLVYSWGMQTRGNEELWFQMWDLYLTEPDAQEKLKLMAGLAGVQVPWILQRFIDLAWDERNVRGQDYFSCIQTIAANRVGESIVWDYVRGNWPQFVARFGLNERYLGNMIPSITSRFSTSLRLQEMRDFFAKYPEAGAGAAARGRALDRVQSNIKWLENNSRDIGEWLNQNF